MLSQEPLSLAELARRELLRDPDRSSTEIATAIGASRGTVSRVRLGLAAAAAQVCLGCPVRAHCLAWSLSLPRTDAAIWAGLGRSGRDRLRAGHEAAQL